jgi:hypothetical protein
MILRTSVYLQHSVRYDETIVRHEDIVWNQVPSQSYAIVQRHMMMVMTIVVDIMVAMHNYMQLVGTNDHGAEDPMLRYRSSG